MKLLWAMIGLLVIGGCTVTDEGALGPPAFIPPDAGLGEAQLADADEFAGLLENPRVFLLNVHTPYEGEIEGTDAIIEDWEHVGLHQYKLPADKTAPIAVYCRSGRMSASAAQQLIDLGYINVHDLEGGMNAWKASGREIAENR